MEVINLNVVEKKTYDRPFWTLLLFFILLLSELETKDEGWKALYTTQKKGFFFVCYYCGLFERQKEREKKEEKEEKMT